MGADNEPEGHPWLRSTPVVLWAGGIGAALVAALVFAVVQMSDEWGKPLTTVVTTAPAVTLEPTTSSSRAPLIVTPSETSSSFTTSVSVSTTDIGLAPPIETTSGTETTDPSEAGPRTTFPSQGRPRATEPEDGSTTTRKRPRLNETRTVGPRP